jgi:predicted phage terminase large subunit-like protein
LIKLDASTIEAFSECFLLDHYDERVPTPEVHRLWWTMVTSENKYVAIAAPRGHAKSTALNHCYGLAASLFERHPFQLKVCKTYDLACEKLDQAKMELTENAKLRHEFRLKKFIRERENDFIAEMTDGYRFRMVAIGMNQAIRGRSFGTMRPTLIQCDDMEDEQEVLDPKLRQKSMRWLMKTLIPMGADRCQVRVYGTILHTDSVLSRLLKMETWESARFEACDAEISQKSILWPERFPREKLIAIRNMMVESEEESSGLSGFLMEYRNIAVDYTTSFIRPEDFVPMEESDHKKNKRFYVGGDLAYSKNQGRDFTVFQVGGLDSDGILHMVDERRGRWDGKQVIDEMYSINEAWEPEEWFIESGAIKETLGTALEMRMRKEGYLNLCPRLIPTKDKAIRGVPFQARMRHKGIRWDTKASWFPAHRQEVLEFTQEGTRGAHDDRFDADAWLAIGLKRMVTAESNEEQEEREFLEDRDSAFEADAENDSVEFKWTGY